MELRLVLTVDDFEAAVRLYRDVLGMQALPAFQSSGGQIALLDAGRATVEVIDEAQAAAIDEIEVGRRVAGPVRIALRVGDSRAAAVRLVDAGGEQLAEPVETPWRDVNVRVQAPDGMQLTLFTPADLPRSGRT
jgi:catechol 2,3-dioxygenase-like lactoylglutathione lyase family enzyme